jgi:hypothetical protein
MAFSIARGRFFAGSAIAGAMLIAAGCQSGDGSSALDVASGGAGQEGRVLESELRAFCPPVQLRQGTSFFNTYERGGNQDPNRVVYQASIADVTRSCTYNNNVLGMTIAVAGRIVPGPKGKAGTITMPIRIVVIQDGQVIKSELYKHPVAIADTIGATQFVFTDTSVSLPMPVSSRTVVYAGYDEGPYDTP